MKRLITAILACTSVLFPATIANPWGTQSTFTITLASLANSTVFVGRQSNSLDNTSTALCAGTGAVGGCADVIVLLKTKTNASGTSATGTVTLYVCESIDGGTTFVDGCGASDAAITLTNPPNARTLAVCATVANSTTYTCSGSVAQALGHIPAVFAIAVVNSSGAALDSTAGNSSLQYRGYYGSVN